jgi:hypothetical protein
MGHHEVLVSIADTLAKFTPEQIRTGAILIVYAKGAPLFQAAAVARDRVREIVAKIVSVSPPERTAAVLDRMALEVGAIPSGRCPLVELVPGFAPKVTAFDPADIGRDAAFARREIAEQKASRWAPDRGSA